MNEARVRSIFAIGFAFLGTATLGFARPSSAATLSRVGGELQINAHTASSQDRAALAFDGDREFVVVWHSIGQDGSLPGVFGRRWSAAGVAQASEFQINTFTPGNQSYPSIAVRAGGDFVVAWRSYQQDGSAFGVFARRFDSAGAALGANCTRRDAASIASYLAPLV